jgi:hypothetical protein
MHGPGSPDLYHTYRHAWELGYLRSFSNGLSSIDPIILDRVKRDRYHSPIILRRSVVLPESTATQ